MYMYTSFAYFSGALKGQPNHALEAQGLGSKFAKHAEISGDTHQISADQEGPLRQTQPSLKRSCVVGRMFDSSVDVE